MRLGAALIAASEQTSTQDVTLGPVTYRLRRLTSMELVEAGSATLLAARPADPYAPPPPIADVQRFTLTVVSVGVTHGSLDGGATWEPLRIVAKREDEDAEAGAVWVEHLIPGHARQLYTEILTLSTDGGRAADVIASFLGGAVGDAPPAR